MPRRILNLIEMELSSMKKILVILIGVLIMSCHNEKQEKVTEFTLEEATKDLEFVQRHYQNMIKSVPDSVLPRSVNSNGETEFVNPADWTSGFYPGILWNLYENSKNEIFRTEALKYTSLLEGQKYNNHTHDLGFMLYCSYGNGYHNTNDSTYKNILITGAKTLSSRFNEKVGCIKSWDWNREWQFPVIVDNMMNLEYLFWATRITGDSTYYKQALSHANVTLKNHFREDNSSFHVVNYDTINGSIIEKVTVQGYSDESIWVRGQAWGLYGYTVMYRETKDSTYLEQANKIAQLIFVHKNMPEDLIPYWDYNAPDIPSAPRDTSAAAIIASALLELGQYVDRDLKNDYLFKASTILRNLSNETYRAKLGENNSFVLKHSTGHLPGNKEIDVPLIYADYYYIEALIRFKNLKKSISS